MAGKLRIAFVVGRDNASTQNAIAQVCESHAVQSVAVLLDTARTPAAGRWRNLKRNVRREGFTYPFHRAVSAIRKKLDQWAGGIIPQDEVEQLLKAAFPERGLDR